jgi:hypothetical protein
MVLKLFSVPFFDVIVPLSRDNTIILLFITLKSYNLSYI